MSKMYLEFTNASELHGGELKYWSNACGDLFNPHQNRCELENFNELPEELQRAFNELWKEGNGCYEYLVEFEGKCYIALISEFHEEFATDLNITMDDLYKAGMENAFNLHDTELFKNTVLILGKGTGFEDCHEFIFLVSAMEAESVYDEIEKTIYDNIWKVEKKLEESNVTEEMRALLKQISDLCYKASDEVYEDEEMEQLGILSMCDSLQDSIDKYLKINDYEV